MSNKGFTLVELLIVIGIITVLSAGIIIAINPALQMEQARDRQREAHVSALYGALTEYRSREGEWPGCVSGAPEDVYYCDELTHDFIANIPEDPSDDCDEGITGYFVKESTGGRVGVRAECTETSDTKIKAGTWD